MASVASSTPEQRHRQLIAASSQANETRVREILAETPFWASQVDRDALRQSLQKVAARDNLVVTKLLLEHGADVEPQRDSETTALFKAAEAGHVDIVAELLAHCANPNTCVRSRAGQTALFPACLRGHVQVVELLLKYGADASVRDREGRTPLLFWAAEKQQQQADTWTDEMLQLLVNQDSTLLEARDPIGRTPLLWAAANGNLQLVDVLLGKNSSPGKDGRSPRPKADVAAVNNRGRSALHLAAEDSQEDMVRLLLQHGADPSASSDGGWTALHNAAQSGHAGVATLLLERGANVNATLSNGMTPLHWAAFNGHGDVVRLLLDRDETQLDIKDSFDRTPMLCAAERFHRDIVQLLSPVHAARRLSPSARIACEEFKATIVDFGNFRDGKQHQVFKKPVFDVLYGWDDENNKPIVNTQTRNIKYQPCFRWIHLPANNIAWVDALLSKWFIEGGHRDIEPFKALQKCFDQEHRGPLAHAHFMRTFCNRIPSMQTAMNSQENDTAAFPPLSEEPQNNSMTSTTPHDQSSGGLETPRKKGKGEMIAERHGRRAKRANGPPGNPPGTKALRARASSGQMPLFWDTSKIPLSNSIFVLFMPFLHYETDERRRRMSRTIDLVRQNQEPTDSSRCDSMLVKGYLNNPRRLHPRRTLDQFFYHGIDTSIRDTDQVVYRYFKRHNLEKKIFMVDQLWLWVLGKDLVVTCFPQRWDQPSRDPLNVIDGIIEDTNAKTRPPVQSVFDLAMLITNRCSGMFDRYRPADQEYQFLDMFESSIGLVTNRESELFMRFNKASAMSAEWLELHRQSQRRPGLSRQASTLLPSPSLSSPSLETSGELLGSTPVFPDALLDIGTETSLLAEIKDIRDELNILFVILDAQMGTLLEFENSIIEELRPEGVSSRRVGGGNIPTGGGGSNNYGAINVDSILAEIRRRSRDQKRLLETHRKDIERMDRQAESIYLSLTHLLDLKQKHSNALEARFARDHAMIAARQGQTVMTFTIVTIIFLPMSFIAAFFSIQVKDWEDTLTVGYVSKYMFGIGLGISIPLVIMAFTVTDIYAAAHGAYAAIQTRGTHWHLPWTRQQHSQQKQQPEGKASSTDDSTSRTMADNITGAVPVGISTSNRIAGNSIDGSSGLPASWRPGSRVAAAGYPRTSLSQDSGNDGTRNSRFPRYGQGSSATATAAAMTGRHYSIGSGHGWSSFDQAWQQGNEDLEKGPPVTVEATGS